MGREVWRIRLMERLKGRERDGPSRGGRAPGSGLLIAVDDDGPDAGHASKSSGKEGEVGNETYSIHT